MSLYGYKLEPTGEAEWIGVYGGSEAHWAARGKRLDGYYGWAWVTACRRLVQPSHFHHWGSGQTPAGSSYAGEPRCEECVTALADASPQTKPSSLDSHPLPGEGNPPHAAMGCAICGARTPEQEDELRRQRQ